MQRVRFFAFAGVLGLLATAALAQGYEDPERGRAARRPDIPTAGFWPTPRMVELFIDRMVEDELARIYKLDEDQVYNTKLIIRERIPAWMNANRGEMMHLMNQYFEALLGGEPPDAEFVAAWAQRALPLLDGFTEVSEGIANEMRTFLTEDQQAVLDGQLAAFRVGVSYMNQRLGGWAEGRFDPETEWPRNREARRAQRQREQEMRAEMERAKREAMGQAAPPAGAATATPAPPEQRADRSAAAAPPAAADEWAKYTEDFIRRYQLNEDQRNTANRILRELQKQRDDYLRRNNTQTRLTDVEQRLRSAGNDDERQRAEAEVARLRKPLERMFAQLKERLEKLPTRAQRAAAAAGNGAAAQATQPADAGAGAKRESPSSP